MSDEIVDSQEKIGGFLGYFKAKPKSVLELEGE